MNWRTWNNLFYRYADQVSIEDEVLVKKNNNLTPVKIQNISNFAMQGNYYSKWYSYFSDSHKCWILSSISHSVSPLSTILHIYQ